MRKIPRIVLPLMLAVALVGFTVAAAAPRIAAQAASAVYYAASNGTGTTCSLASPCSLDAGLGKLSAGDTLYLRGGTYNQTVNIDNSGTAGAYITVAGYPGETAVIDGQGTIGQNDLVDVNGAYVELKDVTIQNSAGNNVVMWGAYDVLTRAFVTRSYANGVRAVGDHQIVQDCRVYYNSLVSEFGKSGGYDGSIEGEHSTHLTIRRNTVWNNWGEGINPYDSSYALVENNVSYDNLRMNYLVDSNIGATYRSNLAYVTPGNALAGYPYEQQGGFVYEEEPDETNAARDNTIVNNLSTGGKYGWSYYYYKTGSGLINVVLANNTFVANGNDGYAAMRFTSGGTHSNTVVYNNIVVQDGPDPIAAVPSGMTGVTFDYNLWAVAPVTAARGPHDVIGNPLLTRTGSLTPGQLTGDWFRLQAGSPAIDRALPLAQVTDDYFGTARGALPDIGGVEYSGGTSPTATSPAPTPTAGPIAPPTDVPTPTATAAAGSTSSTMSYTSTAAEDGYILESSQTSGLGGSINGTGNTFRVGDDASSRQYRAILSFDTSNLPDNATITSVTLRIKQAGSGGSNPYGTLGNIMGDIISGAFTGSNALQASDFQATSSKNGALSIPNAPTNGVYAKAMSSTYFQYVNKAGVTQLRLRFATGDNNNGIADYLSFYTGETATTLNRPTLVIKYTVP